MTCGVLLNLYLNHNVSDMWCKNWCQRVERNICFNAGNYMSVGILCLLHESGMIDEW